MRQLFSKQLYIYIIRKPLKSYSLFLFLIFLFTSQACSSRSKALRWPSFCVQNSPLQLLVRGFSIECRKSKSKPITHLLDYSASTAQSQNVVKPKPKLKYSPDYFWHSFENCSMLCKLIKQAFVIFEPSLVASRTTLCFLRYNIVQIWRAMN